MARSSPSSTERWVSDCPRPSEGCLCNTDLAVQWSQTVSVIGWHQSADEVLRVVTRIVYRQITLAMLL